MRLFIALPLPGDIIQTLIKFREPIRGIKWQKPEQIHLTLRFLGNTSQKQFSILKNKLDVIEMKPFSIRINHLGVFPNKRSSSVIWAGVEKSKPLADLQKLIEGQCRAADF